MQKQGRPIKDYLVDYRGNESIGRGEILYNEGMKDIKLFVDGLVPKASDLPKGVTMSSAECFAVTKLLIKRLATLFWNGKTEIDEKSKALIAYLATALRGALPTDIAEDVKRRMNANGETVLGHKLEQKKDVELAMSIKVNSDIGFEHWMSKALDNAKEAENAFVEVLERLARENKSIVEGQEEDDGMYPFYVFEEGERYSDVPAPKVRAGDVMEVTTSKDLAYFDFVIKAGTAIRYVP